MDNHINPINNDSHTMHYGSHKNGSGTTISFSAILNKKTGREKNNRYNLNHTLIPAKCKLCTGEANRIQKLYLPKDPNYETL